MTLQDLAARVEALDGAEAKFGDHVLNAHPYDVMPEQYRPMSYRTPALRARDAGEGA